LNNILTSFPYISVSWFHAKALIELEPYQLKKQMNQFAGNFSKKSIMAFDSMEQSVEILKYQEELEEKTKMDNDEVIS